MAEHDYVSQKTDEARAAANRTYDEGSWRRLMFTAADDVERLLLTKEQAHALAADALSMMAQVRVLERECAEWKARYEATVAAWEESKQHREHDRKERQELLAELGKRGTDGRG